jgi:hypothetical protein
VAPRRVHYFPRAWTLERLSRWIHAVRRYGNRDRPGDRRRDRRLYRSIVGHHLAVLFVLRVPVLTLAFLAFLPGLALHTARLAPLLENLLVDLGHVEIGIVSTVAFLAAATAVGIINAILVNGHERFPGLPFRRWYGSFVIDLLAIVAPLPLVWTIVRHAHGSRAAAIGTAAAGSVLALAFVLWARIAVLRREARLRDVPGLENWRARPVVYPFPLSIDDRGAPVTANPLTWMARPMWWIQDAASWAVRRARAVVLGDRRAWARHWCRALASAADRVAKFFIPRAGYVYVPPEPSSRRPLYSTHHYALVLLAILAVVYVTLSLTKLLWVGETPYFPTLAYVLLLVWLLCLTLSALTYLLDRYRVPLLLVLGGWALLMTALVQNDHVYATHTLPVPQSRSAPAELLGHAGRAPTILVAAAGGGIQAAAWTARVLTGLAEGIPDGVFERSVRVLSGVSGGSVGVYYFVDAYPDAAAATPTPDRFTRAREAAGASSLDDVAVALASTDLIRLLLPIPVPVTWAIYDRGWALETAFARRSTRPRARLSDWERDVRARVRPAVIFNATLVETGVPIFFSTTRLEGRAGRRTRYDGVDFRSFPRAPNEPPGVMDIELATAVRLSATFPIVSPVARADRDGSQELAQHVADGGYYDNFGMMALIAWLDRALGGLEAPPRDVLVLQIRSFPEGVPGPFDERRGWLYQVGAPFSTMMNVRTSAQRFRNDQELDLLRRYWDARAQVRIDTLAVDYVPAAKDPAPPLSWRLREDQQAALEHAWDELKGGVTQRVRAFLERAGR